jgi:hypothetical protein
MLVAPRSKLIFGQYQQIAEKEESVRTRTEIRRRATSKHKMMRQNSTSPLKKSCSDCSTLK